MKAYKVFIALSIVALVILGLSCGDGKGKECPEVLVADTLANVYDYMVTDTFDGGETRRIRFYDKEDPSKLKYEKRYYRTGQICMEGPLDSDSLRDGRWIAWYDCGKIWSVGDYKHGLRHGENKVYYESGQVQYNKNYVNDTAEGIWTFYLENGTEAMKLVYEKGVVIEQIQLIGADSLRNDSLRNLSR